MTRARDARRGPTPVAWAGLRRAGVASMLGALKWTWTKIRIPRLRSRASLIVATVVLQALVIGGCWVLVVDRAERELSRKMRDEELEDNLRSAERFATVLERDVNAPITPGSFAWGRAQTLVEAYRLSGGAMVYLLDEGNAVLCHPLLRRNRALRRADFSDQTIHLYPTGEEVRLSDLSPLNPVVGRAELLSGPVAMAVAYRPQLKCKVIVQQPEEGMAAAGARVAQGLHVTAGLAALAILALTATGSSILVRRYDSMLERINQDLSAEVARRVKGGLAIRNGLIFGLAKLADYRDTDTGKHLERISRYCELLAAALKPAIEEIDEGWIERLRLASSMHDIGKVGIPDSILLKPGRLTVGERRLMEQHPLIGADTLVAIRKRVGPDDLIEMGVQVALYHHERWDGEGYPLGLSGDDIPLCARLVALADVYDAMTSRRVYKDAMTHAQARELILAERGKAFDPRVVDCFEALSDRFDRVRRELQPDGGDAEKPRLLALAEHAAGLSARAASHESGVTTAA